MVSEDNTTVLSEANSSILEVVGYDYIWIDWDKLFAKWREEERLLIEESEP